MRRPTATQRSIQIRQDPTGAVLWVRTHDEMREGEREEGLVGEIFPVSYTVNVRAAPRCRIMCDGDKTIRTTRLTRQTIQERSFVCRSRSPAPSVVVVVVVVGSATLSYPVLCSRIALLDEELGASV